MKDNLGKRMKMYEASTKHVFPPVVPMIVRVDGKAFHTFTKKMEYNKPYDINLRGAMIAGAKKVIDNAQGIKLAYIQSDEITFVFIEDKFESQKWMGGVKAKIESISSSNVTVGFNKYNVDLFISPVWAEFDARSFTLPFHEVLNNLHWRIVDAERNSIQMLARNNFSHKECENKNTNMLQDMLFNECNINWNDVKPQFKRGTVLTKNETFNDIPRITENKEWWENLIFKDCIYYP